MATNDIVHLDKARAEQAVETLRRAFRDALPATHFFTDPAVRDQVAQHMMRMTVYPSLHFGEVHATSDLNGAAVWVYSDNYPFSFWRMLRSTPLSAIIGFGRTGGPQMQSMGQHIDAVHKRVAPPRHCYLQAIGVAPEFQGQGYAGRLVEAHAGHTGRFGRARLSGHPRRRQPPDLRAPRF